MLALEYAVTRLDAARRATFRLATRATQSAPLTRILARRDTRIAALGSVQVLLLFGLSVGWPVALYFERRRRPSTRSIHLNRGTRHLAIRLTRAP